MRSLVGLTRLSVCWLSLDIKNELEGQISGDIRLLQKMFEEWRKEFNEERPYESLGMKTPSAIYQESERENDPEIVEFDYPVNYRKGFVNNRGFISFKGRRYFVGNPFGGYNIGIFIDPNGRFDAWLDESFLGYFDKEYTLIRRKRRKLLPMSWDRTFGGIICEK